MKFITPLTSTANDKTNVEEHRPKKEKKTQQQENIKQNELGITPIISAQTPINGELRQEADPLIHLVAGFEETRAEACKKHGAHMYQDAESASKKASLFRKGSVVDDAAK